LGIGKPPPGVGLGGLVESGVARGGEVGVGSFVGALVLVGGGGGGLVAVGGAEVGLAGGCVGADPPPPPPGLRVGLGVGVGDHGGCTGLPLAGACGRGVSVRVGVDVTSART
jgi:hypothetical protein